jgi:hypothetical protein
MTRGKESGLPKTAVMLGKKVHVLAKTLTVLGEKVSVLPKTLAVLRKKVSVLPKPPADLAKTVAILPNTTAVSRCLTGNLGCFSVFRGHIATYLGAWTGLCGVTGPSFYLF